MKLAHFALPIVLALVALSLSAENSPGPIKSSMDCGRAVRVEGDVNAPVSEVWRVSTTSKGAAEFFAEKANIGLAIGGFMSR